MEEIPVDITQPNPNGEEFDNLYLDMNGIVHPCTHPEGKPAPKTEEDMMKEIFIYTERVVNMVRPRKLLFMAIDGVAPRAFLSTPSAPLPGAKMNQQRSRRFRSAQEAAQKAKDKEEAIKEWEAMGKEVSEEWKNETGWDTNAITPGTPFMIFLAKSLRYWVAKKMNEDPGWANLQVIISDASVPGEGEHKIMDFVRRQRSHDSHDPNTKHVIYGLDADLIMLSLATHEPHFRVLREDVFAQDKRKGCFKCGQEGHMANQCVGKPKEKQGEADVVKAPTGELKPFIFLDVSVLREYLTVELSAPVHSFAFDLERAIDDWVFLIFFVGNDFLPHLPSLEIREGAIDTLMTIWKTSLDRMGGYLSEHGHCNLKRAKIILEGLASREDEIFRKRREAEERQDRNEKRRKIEAENRKAAENRVGGMHVQNGHDYVPVKPSASSRPGLPAKPTWETPLSSEEKDAKAKEVAGMVGSNSDIVRNRGKLRMANLSAAEMLKAEMSDAPASKPEDKTASSKNLSAAEALKKQLAMADDDVEEMKEEGAAPVEPVLLATPAIEENTEEVATKPLVPAAEAGEDSTMAEGETSSPRGHKRKAEEVEKDEAVEAEEETDGADAFLKSAVVAPAGASVPAPLKMMGNNVVEQEDTVKLWEPGYKERYYRQKFGVELSDFEFRKSLVQSYTEGLCWVLEYYFQGTPSWQWYYPQHFSPFASDFVDVVEDLEINFTLGQPFRPYEQLMGVFPAASRIHLPVPFQSLMTDDDSPIIDFYPEDFAIDMNGKKMLWQGVALLPFIDPVRLLDAMGTRYPQLTDAENARNTMGVDTLFVSQDHPLYDYLEGLYTKKKITDPVELDTKRSKGISGYVLPDPDCVPGATFDSPLPTEPDIIGDRSISATFKFPAQRTPHRSKLLPGATKDRGVLTQHDKETVRRGGNSSGPSYGEGFHSQRRNDQSGPGFAKLNQGRPGDRGGGRQSYQPAQSSYNGPSGGGYGGGGNYGPPAGGRDPYAGYGGHNGGGSYGGNGAYGGAGQYGGYGYRPPGAGYQPPAHQGGGYQPPAQPGYGAAPPSYGGYGAPAGRYGGGGNPPAPSYQGYGGYGGAGRGGGGQGGQGARRY
ncbi:5'-3' exoribonuclease 2 [Pseudohyphozyma bogoriensis]|nr:5'-3' exoribonuclease 2 [Pseudohyphozyma bogoriensis]